MKPLTPASPHAIIMVGIPGSGKSTFAEHFANTFQAPIINSDALQRELNLDTQQITSLQKHMLQELLKTHRTLLVEGMGEKRVQRAELVRTITKAGYKPLIVWVQTDPTEAKRRATKPHPRGSGLTAIEFDERTKQFQAPTAAEGALVISGKHTYATQLKVVLKQLASVPRPPVEQGETEKPAARPRARGIMVQ